MEPTPRYEILDTIASGDFAVVYRARDRELGREVAIKQIHQQFLHDQRQLARYWQEAQLLASLQHPNVVTIYDIVRSRGWLILELMRGSLKPFTQAEPLDLDALRVAMVCALNGLHFLHANGIIHGDIKPSNLLLDNYNRVKLGDFGLARRATSDEGSLLKGTTKYMAPELASTQFGPVGPAADLYSLGFTAYELLCGGQFEALFPGLEMFGRDRQIAWLMWHTAADRHLPPIARVLAGVPDDLARAIERMTEKDQARRYQTAQDVLRDLRPDRGSLVAPPEPPQAAPKKKRRALTLAVTFLLGLVAVVAVLLLLPARSVEKKPLAAGPPRGIVRGLYLDERKFVIESAEDGKPREVSVKPRDRVFVNGKAKLLRDLKSGDRVVLKTLRDAETGGAILEIEATRPEVHVGRIATVQPPLGLLTVRPSEGEDQGKDIVIAVPPGLAIRFNGRDQQGGEPFRLGDLKPDDRVVVHHVAEETGRSATELQAERVVPIEGVVRNVDSAKKELTFALGEGDQPELLTLPYAEPCEVTINERRFLDQRLLQPGDLRPGDKVKAAHDTRVVRVDAYRVLGQAGAIRRIDYANRTLEVLMEGQPAATTYLTAPGTIISLAGEQVTLDELRAGDNAEITHDTPDAKTPQAKTISAQRPADRQRFALLIATENYEDVLVTKPVHAVDDARLLADVLTKRHAVPAEQVLTLADESLVRLEQGIPAFLGRLSAESKLLVYYAGQAYKDDEGRVFLAPKNFSLRKMSSSGLALQWLVDQMEQCPAGEKLLLLDSTRDGEGIDLKNQPSAAEMVRTLKAPPGYAPLRTVTVIAAGKKGERGQVLADKRQGLFAQTLANGFSGQADKNRDRHLETTELFGFLTAEMAAAAGKLGKPQSPELFLPDARPPRLSDEAKKAIRGLAALVRLERSDAQAARDQYAQAQQLAGNELEPKLLFGLTLMKVRIRDEATRQAHEEALKVFQEVAAEQPAAILPQQAIAWLQFEKLANEAAAGQLAELVKRLAARKEKTLSPRMIGVLVWSGQLREYATTAAQEGRRASEPTARAIDAAVTPLGPDAERFYLQGRDRTRATVGDFEKKIAGASDEASAAKYRVERRQLNYYASFPFEDALQEVLAGLDN